MQFSVIFQLKILGPEEYKRLCTNVIAANNYSCPNFKQLPTNVLYHIYMLPSFNIYN